jgi:large subunit ribosomal protein L10
LSTAVANGSDYKFEVTKLQIAARNESSDGGSKEIRGIGNMAVSKAKKKEQVEKLSADLKNVSNAVVATYSKLTVAQDYELRKALRGAGAKYQVVKNTLAERAGKGTKIEGGLQNLTGVTSIAYTTGDPVAMAKALTKYAKDTPEFTFKVGVVEGKVISIKEIEALATMPSKEELMSKLLFLINAPAQRLVTAMGAVGRNLAVVVDQGVQGKKFKEA